MVLPGAAGDEHEDDFVLIAAAWVTGWHATELAGVRAADTVAVFGAGAVGLLAACSALLRGASEVYSVDLIHERLDKAAELALSRSTSARETRPGRSATSAGRARPGQIVTHHESLENAPSIYDRFDRRVDGIVKAAFHH